VARPVCSQTLTTHSLGVGQSLVVPKVLLEAAEEGI